MRSRRPPLWIPVLAALSSPAQSSLALSSLALLPHALSAQEPTGQQDPAVATPAAQATPATGAHPVLRLAVAGPAVWRAHFAPTNIGSLMVSEAGAELRQQVLGPLENAARQLAGLDDDTYAAARKRLLDYTGVFELSVWFQDGPDDPVVELLLRPDGRTDLGALAEDLASLAGRAMDVEWEGDGEDRVLPMGNRVLTAPVAVDDCMMAWVGGRDQLAAARRRATGSPIAAAANHTRGLPPPLRLEIDATAGVGAFLEDHRRDEWTPDEAETAAGFAAAGLRSLGDFTLQLGTAGPHVRLDLEQQFVSDDRGLFAMFFPDRQGVPAISALQPHPRVGWKAGRFDLELLPSIVMAIAKASGKDVVEVRTEMEKQLGGDEKTGLLSHFTDEYLLFGTVDSVFEPDDDRLTWGAVFRIDDAEGFAPKWRALRKEVGMTGLSEDDLGDGYTIQRLGGFFQTTAMLGPDLFGVAYGPEAEDRFREVITSARNTDWTAKPQPPADARPMLRHAPPGLNGIAQGDVATMFVQVGIVVALLGELVTDLPTTAFDEPGQEELQKLLKEHDLQTAWSMTGYADGRWHFRVLW